MDLYLDSYLEDGELEKNITLERLTDKYGFLYMVNRDLKDIESELKQLEELKERWLIYQDEINKRIEQYSNMEYKYILKVNESPKKDKYDIYSLFIEVLKVDKDITVIIDDKENIKLSFKERGKVFDEYIKELIKKYNINEIYSNKEIKGVSYKNLNELSI